MDGSGGPPTIYDVARAAGVSIASVSRVLNGRRNPLPDTKERVERAVAELGFIPDGSGRGLATRLKEVVGVVIRRPTVVVSSDGIWEDEPMCRQTTVSVSSQAAKNGSQAPEWIDGRPSGCGFSENVTA